MVDGKRTCPGVRKSRWEKRDLLMYDSGRAEDTPQDREVRKESAAGFRQQVKDLFIVSSVIGKISRARYCDI
jgi:hypothetical protein